MGDDRRAAGAVKTGGGAGDAPIPRRLLTFASSPSEEMTMTVDRGPVAPQTPTEPLKVVVDRLVARWGPPPPKPKLTLIQGGRKD
jgi:hypothetical protein